MSTIQRTMKHWEAIQREATAWGIDPLVLAGLVCAESGGEPLAIRYESDWGWRDLDLERPRGSTSSTEFTGQAFSWGLCQIMGTVARERGFTGWFPQLCEPDTGLHYGASQLAYCLKWARTT